MEKQLVLNIIGVRLYACLVTRVGRIILPSVAYQPVADFSTLYHK
jgi:hypothetical protein